MLFVQLTGQITDYT